MTETPGAFGAPVRDTWLHARRRLAVRRTAAGLAPAVAVLYALIASSVVTVLEGPAAQVARDQLAFAAPAAGVYLLGAVLLVRYDRRRIWVLGALLQVGVIAVYLDLASQRAPAFEVWGLTIRVLQGALLAVLLWLTLQAGRQPPASSSRAQGDAFPPAP